jgi:hypothetical protein
LKQVPKLIIKGLVNSWYQIIIYENDILFGATNEFLYKWFKKCMHTKFKFKYDDRNSFLSWTSNQANKRDIFLNQAKYTKKLFKRFGLDDS